MSKQAHLTGVAKSISHQFSISAAHFAFIARENSQFKVYIDLLTGTIEPEIFQEPRNQNLVSICQATLGRAIVRLGDCKLSAATVLVQFNFDADEFKNTQPAKCITMLAQDNGTQSIGTQVF